MEAMKRQGRLLMPLPSVWVLRNKHGADDEKHSSPESWRRDSSRASQVHATSHEYFSSVGVLSKNSPKGLALPSEKRSDTHACKHVRVPASQHDATM